MALKLSVEKYGVAFVNAYHRINEINVSKEEGIHISIDVFKDAEAALVKDAAQLLCRYNYIFDLDLDSKNNILAEGYILLKTLDVYKDAVDL